MFKQWTAGVMPTTILVDRQGRARWRSVGEIGANDKPAEGRDRRPAGGINNNE
jgi:hypothetical protein